ncbi:MAG TPA: hypothetical protein DHV62_09620 [Elusimicrobia bacterium]|nr:hypothetical protein [Elusimicrobiota bacterium]
MPKGLRGFQKGHKSFLTEKTKKKISKTMKLIGNCPPHFSGEKSSNWKGGKIFRSGYYYINKPEHPYSGKQGYIAEHRLVMEKNIGRYLKKEEVVHHINGVLIDNRIENLILFPSRGKHTKLAHPEIKIKSSLSNKGKHRSPKTEFKKGMIPWNKKLVLII